MRLSDIADPLNGVRWMVEMLAQCLLSLKYRRTACRMRVSERTSCRGKLFLGAGGKLRAPCGILVCFHA